MHFFIFPSYNFKKEARKQTGHLLTGFFFVDGGKPFVGADAYIHYTSIDRFWRADRVVRRCKIFKK